MVLRVLCGGERRCGRSVCRSLLIRVSRGQYGFFFLKREREGESERHCDVDKMSFRCIPCFTARPRRQRLILHSPLLQNGVAG